MSGKPTIEERMRAVSYSSPDRYEAGVRYVHLENATDVAREYAAGRTAPLVAALLNLVATYETGHETGRSMRGPVEDARAALAAEKEARR